MEPMTLRAIGGGTSVASRRASPMGFLDAIGQRVPESRPQKPRPDVAQRLTWDQAVPGNQTAPPQESPRSNRIHPAVIWSAAVVVVAAVAVAAWLGVRNFATVVAPHADASADAPPAVETHAEKPSPTRRSVRPRAAVRSAAKNENAVGTRVPEASAETANEASVSAIGAISHVATVTETETAPIETTPDPIAAALVTALPEDDYVYSSEHAGVVAPRLVSLGFVHRLVTGFDTRTSTLELLISKSGTVERARIFTPSRNWEDAMLLSRAKTFQFVPAQRNGFPVRYRFVMEVDATP
jgi:hypothetical protein